MAPPFLAYYGAATKNATVLRTAVEQSLLYRDILTATNFSTTPSPPLSHPSIASGLWVHIIGPQTTDPGIWSTGNAWAAAGMMRVLATLVKSPKEIFVHRHKKLAEHDNKLTKAWKEQAIVDLTTAICCILDASIDLQPLPTDNSSGGGLLRNYLDDSTWFGETSGSALLASVAYRLVTLAPSLSLPDWSAQRYVNFAECIRLLLGNGWDNEAHVTENGTVTPAVNPLGWGDRAPWTAGSPEGQNFVVLMYAAWRDWVEGGKQYEIEYI